MTYTARPNAGRPPVKMSQRAGKAWRALNERAGAVHSLAGIDRRAFEELERNNLAVVTLLGRGEWVAERGPAYRLPLSAVVPGPPTPPVLGDDVLADIPRRVRGAAQLEAARIHRDRGYDYMEVSVDGSVAGWVYGIYNRDFGWVTVDTQTEQPRYASRDEAADALRLARQAELRATEAARRAVAQVHPDAYIFRPVLDEEGELAGWTFRLSAEWGDGSSWVAATGAVGRRRYPSGGAAKALLEHVAGPADLWLESEARPRVRAAYRRAFDLYPVTAEGGNSQFLGWVFSVVPTDFGYTRTFEYGWMTQAGVLGEALVDSREAASRALAASWTLDQPFMPGVPS